MLVKITSEMLFETPGVNFTNVLHAAFAPTVLRQLSTNLKRKHKKATSATYVHKSCTYNVGEIDLIKFASQVIIVFLGAPGS
jgi:hypothetical protein